MGSWNRLDPNEEAAQAAAILIKTGFVNVILILRIFDTALVDLLQNHV